MTRQALFYHQDAGLLKATVLQKRVPAMTPYTKTLIGHLTKVETGSLSARLVEDDEGRLPRISASGDDDMRAQPGSYVAIVQANIRILAVITTISEVPDPDGSGSCRMIHLIPLGEIVRSGTFQNGVKNYPVTGAEVHTVNKEDVEAIFIKFRSQGYAVGNASADETIDVCLDPAALFGRHFAILGQSGAGKSWTVANLLQRAVRTMPNAHIVLLDLHGEYSWLDNEGTRQYAFDSETTRYIDARDRHDELEHFFRAPRSERSRAIGGGRRGGTSTLVSAICPSTPRSTSTCRNCTTISKQPTR